MAGAARAAGADDARAPALAPGLRRRGVREGARAVQPRPRLDAARGHDGQERLRLARPAPQAARPAHPRPRRHTRRGARPAGAARLHRALAHRPLAAEPGLPEDQEHLRQPRRGGLGLFALRLRHRRRAGRPRRLREPARPLLAPGHPAGQRHGAQPHGHRLEVGGGAPRLVPPDRPPAVPRPHLQRPRPVSDDPRVAIQIEDGYWNKTRRGGGLQAHRPQHRPGALHLSRQRRHQHAVERHRPARLPAGRGARGGACRPSCTWRGTSRSSASTRP